MTQFRWALANVALIASLMILAGCDGRPSVESGNSEATVTGTVRDRSGELIESGLIQFDPSNYQRKMEPVRETEITNGNYTITTLTGENRIQVFVTTENSKNQITIAEIPFQVEAGENTFDIGPAELGGGAGEDVSD